MTSSSRRLDLLNWEVNNLRRSFLDRFDHPSGRGDRQAALGDRGTYAVVKAFPLPDGYRPDQLDILVRLHNFPSLPPIGLYLLNRGNESLVRQISSRFNAFADAAFHDAEPIPGMTLVCYHYAGNGWRYNAANPASGDNLAKFLASFYSELMH